MSATPGNLARAAALLGGLSVRHPIPYLGSVPLKIDPSVIEGVAEALDAAVDAERAAVVAYLRGEAASALNILDVANDIEAGEHIAKEQG